MNLTSPKSLTAGALALVAAAALLVPAPRPVAAEDAPKDAAALRARAEESMRKGFKWLAAQQHDNGGFGAIPDQKEKGESGITGLVLRAFAKAPPALRKDLEPSMARAASYLVGLQQADGSIANPGSGLTTYRTAIAITALLAYDPAKYAAPIEKARGFIVATQFSEEHGLEGGDPKKSPYYGGWGYDKSGTKPDADMSNVQFALEALREAGLPPDSPVFKRAAIFLQRCQNRSETNDVPAAGVKIGNDGGFMYDPALDTTKSEPVKMPDGATEIPSYGSMTYAGLMGFLNASVSRDDARVKAAYAWIQRHYTLDENPGIAARGKPQSNKQGLYYYFHTFAKALDRWGAAEVEGADGKRHAWARDLVEKLAALQKPEGFWVNSEEPRWWESEPVLVSAYSLIALDYAYPWLDKSERAGAEPKGAPGGPALCEKCAGKAFTTDIGTCTSCAATTASGSFELCPACARKKGQCQACQAPLGKNGSALVPAGLNAEGICASCDGVGYITAKGACTSCGAESGFSLCAKCAKARSTCRVCEGHVGGKVTQFMCADCAEKPIDAGMGACRVCGEEMSGSILGICATHAREQGICQYCKKPLSDGR